MSHSHPTRCRGAAALAPLALLAAALAGCNGGDSQGMAAAPAPSAAPPAAAAAGSVPATALASVPAFIQFVGGLAPDDTREPLSVMGTSPPVSDSDEPQGI